MNKIIKNINKPEVDRKIVVLFLEKLELLTKEERREILKTIQFLNYTMFLVNN